MNETSKFEDLSLSPTFFGHICDKYFYSSEWLTFTVCIYISFQIIFWLYNSFLLYIEYHDIPWIDQYRIQKHKPKLRFQPKMICQMRNDTIIHQISFVFVLSLIYLLLNRFGHVSVR